MRIWKLSLAAIAAALTLLLPLATQAEAQRGMEVAVEDDTALTTSGYNADKAINSAIRLRASSIRFIVSWADVGGANAFSRRVPKHRKYSFHSYDGAVNRAFKNNIKVQMVLAGPGPAWATGNHRKSVVDPNPRYFGEFAKQAALWFGQRVQRYSIWNEPNFLSWLQPQSRATSIYRSLYSQGYTNIKRVSPTAQVLIAETSPYSEGRLAIAPLAFLRGVLCNGRCKLKTDGYAHHPYDFYHRPDFRYPGADNVTLATLSRLNSALAYWSRRGTLRTPHGGTPPIYLSEYGYLSSGRGRINDTLHGRYLKQAFDIAARTPHVMQLLQYTLIPPKGRYAFFDMSILTSRWKSKRPFRDLAAWSRTAQKRHLISVPY